MKKHSKIYDQWITSDRPEISSSSYVDVNRAIESDHGRIIFSSPFRRLQNKAQVFPLEGNAAVRSRLTHSLEVAHLGKYIAQKVLEVFSDEDIDSLGLKGKEAAFSQLVENSCLLHDIGNPPFGHFGEAAIREWFSKKGHKSIQKSLSVCHENKKLNEYLKKDFTDFLSFDGNAQGFRIITKLQGEDGKTGLNLTFSQLASYLKYTCLPQNIADTPRVCKKAGYFNTENDIASKVKTKLQIKDNHRFPLAYLMEAADDIAYCLSDIEDGIEKGVLNFDEIKKKLKETQSDSQLVQKASKNVTTRVSNFVFLRTTVFNTAVQEVAENFVKNHDKICNGEHIDLIEKDSDSGKFFSFVRKDVASEVYCSPDAEHVELAGHSVVYGLLDKFSTLLNASKEDFSKILKEDRGHCKEKGLDLEIRLSHMLPKTAINAYHEAIKGNPDDYHEWHSRAHLILDYICGMTDEYSLKTFQLLSGIRVVS